MKPRIQYFAKDVAILSESCKEYDNGGMIVLQRFLTITIFGSSQMYLKTSFWWILKSCDDGISA